MPAMAEYAAMWKGRLSDPPGWLAARGWRPSAHDHDEVSIRYGRDDLEPTAGGFITASLT